MNKYEYRLMFLEFDSRYVEGQINGKMIHGLEPGERVFTTFGKPEQSSGMQHNGYETWYIPALIEKKTQCFAISGSRAATPDELEELTKKLRREK